MAKSAKKTGEFSTFIVIVTKDVYLYVDLPISSINGAIRNVTPTKSKHINKSRHAVAMIVHRARCDISSGSITCAQNVECNGMEWNEREREIDVLYQ